MLCEQCRQSKHVLFLGISLRIWSTLRFWCTTRPISQCSINHNAIGARAYGPAVFRGPPKQKIRGRYLLYVFVSIRKQWRTRLCTVTYLIFFKWLSKAICTRLFRHCYRRIFCDVFSIKLLISSKQKNVLTAARTHACCQDRICIDPKLMTAVSVRWRHSRCVHLRLRRAALRLQMRWAFTDHPRSLRLTIVGACYGTLRSRSGRSFTRRVMQSLTIHVKRLRRRICRHSAARHPEKRLDGEILHRTDCVNTIDTT